MDGGDWASIAAAIFAALAAIAVQRSSSKASIVSKQLETDNNRESVRAEAEKDAYERARSMDVATIERLSREIAEVLEKYNEVKEQNEFLNADVKRVDADNRSLHEENRKVLEDNARLRAEVRALRIRQARLERGLNPDGKEEIAERREDLPPWSEADRIAHDQGDDPHILMRGDEDV